MKKLCLFGVAVIVSLMCVYTARGFSGDDAFLKALQDSLHKLGDPWIAGTTSVSHLSWEEKQKLCGLRPLSLDKLPKKARLNYPHWKDRKAPPHWDWRDVNEHDWMTQPKFQGACGSCCHFAATAAFEARYKIVNELPDDRAYPDFSEQFMVSCDTRQNGCVSGVIYYADLFIVETGLPDEDCYTYRAQDATSGAPCSDACGNWVDRVEKASDCSHELSDVSQYKQVIMDGPAVAGINAKEDFFYYKGGIYDPVMGRKYNHAVCICGWDDASNSWLIKNSHGTGEDQFQWISEAPEFISWVTVDPYNQIILESRQFSEPNDGIWDPGESIDVVATLKAKGIDYTGVTGKLSTTDSKVNISNDTYSFGLIPNGSSSDNSSSPFIATADASIVEHDVEFNLHVTADGEDPQDLPFIIAIGIARYDYVDVSANNAMLTVTDNSAIGFEEPDGNGSGFVYPASGSNTLCYASMAFGNSSSYLVDNFYLGNDSDKDWKTTTSPNGRIHWVLPPTRGDTMNVGYYDDSGISGAKNVVCRQEAWAFKDQGYDDFVIISFCYTNKGSSSLDSLYSAIFADFDIGDAAHNNADINESKYLAWVSGGSVYVGITLLDPFDKLVNASTLKNSSFIGSSGMSDDDQYKFMNKTHHFGSQANSDYSAIVSAGPFDLAPGGSQTVVFAVVGGSSKSEIEAHSDAARSTYGIQENTKVMSENVVLDIIPSPILNTATITFYLPNASNVMIDVYDIAGRNLQNLKQGQFKAGIHTLQWDTKKVSAGVFFVKLQTGNRALVKKVLVF